MVDESNDISAEIFNLQSLRQSATGYSACLSDGKNLYLVPLNNNEFFGEVARYESNGRFTDSNSWSFFDVQSVYPQCAGFTGGVFDGNYIYLIPYCNGQFHGSIVRFDTRMDFYDLNAWITQDTMEFNSKSRGFVSGVFDGRFIYLSPYQNGEDEYSGTVARYDTRLDFSSKEGWEFFDMTAINSLAKGFHGAIYANNSIFFVPYVQEHRQFHGNLVRYNNLKPFSHADSWQTYNLEKINSNAKGFVSGIALGDTIYLAPYYNGLDRSGLMVSGTIIGNNSLSEINWRCVDTERFHLKSKGYFGAVSVDSSIYYIPHCLDGTMYNGLIAKLDSTSEFTDSHSWNFFDIQKVDSLASGFMGGIYLNGWIYLAPFENRPGDRHGRIARVRPW